MIKTRSDAAQVWVVNPSAAGAASGSTNIVNSAGWIVAVSNTSPLVQIQNSANWVVYVANTVPGGSAVTIVNSGGLFANQSGAWAVSSTILNSAGWVVSISNTSPLVSIQNSAGWVFAQSNTDNQGVIVRNSGGLFAQQSGSWTVTVANTGGTALSQTLANTAGWVVTIANTGGTALSQTIANTAGWIVAVSNTGGASAITNSSGWIIYNVESGFPVVIVTTVVSTIGLVTILTNNNLRRGLSIYNFSTSPFYFKLGASANTTSYTLMMVSSGYYELPKPVYTGLISGLWGSANGYALISELTG